MLSKAPEILAELGPEQFALWRRHPVTDLVLRFLADHAEASKRDMLDAWMNGALKLQDEQVLRGRVMLVGELADLSLVSIKTFYGVA